MKFPLPKVIFVAVIGIVAAVTYANMIAKVEPVPQPLREPVMSVYPKSIAGAGIVESMDDNVAVSVYTPGKVDAVYVQEGQMVQAGTPLFKMDDQDLMAQLKSLQAQVKSQQAVLNRLLHLPRKEDATSSKAQVKIEEAKLAKSKTYLQKLENITDKRAMSQDKFDSANHDVEIAQAGVNKAKADYANLLAGAWRYDIQKTEADLDVLRAQEKVLKVNISRTLITAPKHGKVLQVNVRKGEFASASSPIPPILLGDTSRLQVRVDIDEVSAADVKPHMPATGFIKGDTSKKFALKFERIEPYIVPKKNLTGDNTERVDIRVLQLIYSFDPPPFPVYVGQQIDVFLKR